MLIYIAKQAKKVIIGTGRKTVAGKALKKKPAARPKGIKVRGRISQGSKIVVNGTFSSKNPTESPYKRVNYKYNTNRALFFKGILNRLNRNYKFINFF